MKPYGTHHDVGVVVIGRNEGERLRRCLMSLTGIACSVVYVDSGSSDGSVALAGSMSFHFIELDMSRPFTAARARNAGFEYLLSVAPAVRYVQFVDGDCEIVPGWLDTARTFLQENDRVAVASGRRRERYPDASVYNRLCDLEWDAPVGETTWCGGDTMVRAEAFMSVGGFDSTIIAGEEPELCIRLRRLGWKIFRLDAEMTLHDAATTQFRQWWKRAKRTGHGYAEVAQRHGRSPERHGVRASLSAWIWGLIAPALAITFAWPTSGLSLLVVLLAYIPIFLRAYLSRRRRGEKRRSASVFALFCVLAKSPHAIGQIRYHVRRLFGRVPTIIEYKGRPSA